MPKQDMLDRLSSIAAILACVVISGVAIQRGLSSRVNLIDVDMTTTELKNWESLKVFGSAMGSTDAPVQVVEFSDLECPFCRRFHQLLDEVQLRWPGMVGITYIHFPIATHRFATIAAQGAECAKLQGSFREFVGRTFTVQDSLGLKSWASIAGSAGVSDTIRFNQCLSGPPVAAIAEGKRIGDSLGIRGTPTVIINGMLYSSPPSASTLDSLIGAVAVSSKPIVNRSN